MSEEKKTKPFPKKEKKRNWKKELKEYKNKYLLLLADMENTRKRLQKEKQEISRFAIENTIIEFLPLLDNFENALNFAQSSSEEVQKWASGFQMILSQFRNTLQNMGIVAFHSKGNNFDPHLHEAMEIEETDLHPDGKILQEFTKGYKSKDRIIRPAHVKVAKNIKKEIETEDLQDTKLK